MKASDYLQSPAAKARQAGVPVKLSDTGLQKMLHDIEQAHATDPNDLTSNNLTTTDPIPEEIESHKIDIVEGIVEPHNNTEIVEIIEPKVLSSRQHGGRTPGAVNLTPAERVAVTTMLAKGESISGIARVLHRDRATIRRFVKLSSRDSMVADLPDYVEIHKKAAVNAAEDGDAKPAQWALERLGVVKPLPQANAGGAGFNVKIGLLLPGLPGYKPQNED